MRVRKLLCLGMTAVLLCSNLPQMEVHAQEENNFQQNTEYASEANEFISGKCGENVNYEYNPLTETMRIYGEGPMYDYYRYSREDPHPWFREKYALDIKKVKIEDGVTYIGNQAFFATFDRNLILSAGCGNLESVEIADTVTDIGDSAFSGCRNLKTVRFPNNLKTIGSESFYSCRNLKTVRFPDNLKTIGRSAFSGAGIKELHLPYQLESIGDSAFEYCEDVTEISFPSKLRSIGTLCFQACINLKQVDIPGNCDLGSQAFYKCTGLEHAIIGSNCSISSYVFEDCTSLLNVTVEKGCISVGGGIFSGCTNLQSVLLPDGWEHFSSFSGCENLIDIQISDTSHKYKIVDKVLYSKDGSELVYYPQSLTAREYEIPDDVTSIGAYAFSEQGYLEHVIIPESVQEIGACAFKSCSKLNYVIVPEGVQELGNNVFSSCSSLNAIVLPASLKSVVINFKHQTSTFLNTPLNVIYAEEGSYAQEYAEDKYKQTIYCSFNADGGTVSPQKRPVIYNDKYYKLPVPVREGYNFLGWYTESGDKVTDNTIMSSEVSHTLYAHWERAGKSFVWGKNNWKFDNTSRYFSNYNVNNDVMNKMKKDFNLSNSDIVELKWNIANDNASGFQGSCFGMTISEIMASQGNLKLSRYGGHDVVNQNTNTSNMTSVINFIQELQSNSEMCQSIRQTPFLRGNYTQKEFISKLSDVAENSNYLVKLSYKIVNKNMNNGSISSGYHAVLVYGLETCNYYSNVTGKTYDRKVLIADPNYLSGNNINNDACLYFKSSDSSWIVPYWNKTYSNGRVQSCYWNAETGTSTNDGGIRNIMRYESLKEEVDLMSELDAGHYIAGLEIDNESQNVSSVEKVKNSGNPNADYVGDFSDEIVRYDLDMDDSIYMTENDELYALWNPTSSYTLSYLKPSDYNLKMDYETVDYYADVTNSTYTLFKPSGSITLKGSDADYDITMVTEDADCVTDWYAVGVSGTDVDNLVYTKVKNGYTLSASNLRNVKISAEGEDFNANTTFSTDYGDVFIYEIDKNTIGVKVDTDKNGTYETPLVTEDAHQYGSEWKADGKSHWKECKCGEKSELSTHEFKWIIDKNATTIESGLKHEECSVCGYKRKENTLIAKQIKIPKKGQKLTDKKTGAVYKVVNAKTKGGTVEYAKPLNNKNANISIPSTVKINGISYKVTSIAANAFKNNKKLAKVKIGSNVTSIGKNSFSGCGKLKTLTIGNNVVSIGDNAFLNCTSLKTVTIPAKVKKIGKQAFCGCKKLKTVTIKTKKLVGKNVGNKAFARINQKTTVKVPSSCLKSYKKLLQKKGLNGKKQKIKK